MQTALRLLTIFAAAPLYLFAAEIQPLLLQQPTVSQNYIVFAYAGDLWRVARQGGEAVRLTAGTGTESHPVFSPDGSQIAFHGEYEGNGDVYVIPVLGGQPKRLTFHPENDIPVGWSPDGKQILFRTNRDSYSRFTRLYRVSSEGGFPAPVDLPQAFDGSYSPDATQMAYMPSPLRSQCGRTIAAARLPRFGSPALQTDM